MGNAGQLEGFKFDVTLTKSYVYNKNQRTDDRTLAVAFCNLMYSASDFLSKTRGSVVGGFGGLCISVLFPYTRNFAPRTLTLFTLMNKWVLGHTAGFNPATDQHSFQGGLPIPLVSSCYKTGLKLRAWGH